MLSKTPIIMNPVDVATLAAFNPSAKLVNMPESPIARSYVTNPHVGRLAGPDPEFDPSRVLERAARRFGASIRKPCHLYEQVQSRLGALVKRQTPFRGIEKFVSDALASGELSFPERLAIADTLLNQLRGHRASAGLSEDERLPRQSYGKRHVTVSLAVRAIASLNENMMQYSQRADIFSRFIMAYGTRVNTFARLYIDYDGFEVNDSFDDTGDGNRTRRVALDGWTEFLRQFPEGPRLAFLGGGVLCLLNTSHLYFEYLSAEGPEQLLSAAIERGGFSDAGLKMVLGALNTWRKNYLSRGEVGLALLRDVETLRALALRQMIDADEHLVRTYIPEFKILALNENPRIGKYGIEALATVFDKLPAEERSFVLNIFLDMLEKGESDQRFRASHDSLINRRDNLTPDELGHVRAVITALIGARKRQDGTSRYKLKNLLSELPVPAAQSDSDGDQ